MPESFLLGSCIMTGHAGSGFPVQSFQEGFQKRIYRIGFLGWAFQDRVGRTTKKHPFVKSINASPLSVVETCWLAGVELLEAVGARPDSAPLGSGTAFSTASPTLSRAWSTLAGSATDCTPVPLLLVSVATGAASFGAAPACNCKLSLPDFQMRCNCLWQCEMPSVTGPGSNVFAHV